MGIVRCVAFAKHQSKGDKPKPLSGRNTMNTKQSTADYLQECRVALSSEQARPLAETDNWSHVDKQQVHL
jgi:hypothetical protein